MNNIMYFLFSESPQITRRFSISISFIILLNGYSYVKPIQATNNEQLKIFSLQQPKKSMTNELPELGDPYVYGLSWRYQWKAIAPDPNQIDWSPIDKAIEMTAKMGKKVMLRVVAGMNTPEWVYEAGARKFAFSGRDLAHPENYPRNMRMPIPWDEIYLVKWEEFIKAFGQRYNGNRHIYSIQMSGGGHIGEMNLPKAFQKWRSVDYSDENLITAWKRIIDTYQKAFSQTPTNLDINEPLNKHSDVLRSVVSYVLDNYPRKVYLQQNGLRADFPRTDRIREILRDAARKTIVGYQMLGGKGWLDEQTGDRLTAFRNAREDLASYIEIYSSDARDPAHNAALRLFFTQSEKR